MADAVIVSTSRTPIGRANKGSLVDARPDDMSAHTLSDVLSKVDICLLYTSPSPRDS